MDSQTMKAGLLMEAADANQKLATAAITRLEAATRTLEPAVRDAVAKAALEEFRHMHDEAKRTAVAFKQLRSGLTWKIGLVAFLMSAASAGVLLATIYFAGGLNSYSGPPAAPTGLRGDPAALAEFGRRGQLIEVALCGEQRRVCVRVEPKAGAFGARKDQMVAAGGQ
jgi:hypothetical protein